MKKAPRIPKPRKPKAPTQKRLRDSAKAEAKQKQKQKQKQTVSVKIHIDNSKKTRASGGGGKARTYPATITTYPIFQDAPQGPPILFNQPHNPIFAPQVVERPLGEIAIPRAEPIANNNQRERRLRRRLEQLPLDAGYSSGYLGGNTSSGSYDYNNQTLASIYPANVESIAQTPTSVQDKIRNIEQNKSTFLSQYDAQLAREEAERKATQDARNSRNESNKPKRLPESMINPITGNYITTSGGHFKKLLRDGRLFIKDGKLFETKKNE